MTEAKRRSLGTPVRDSHQCRESVKETLLALKMDPSLGMAASAVASSYLASVEGETTGQIIDPRKFVAK
jgi:hypothetical protein